MGYISKDIAVITEPKRVTLASVQNFVQFASKARVQSKYLATIGINAVDYQWIPGTYYNAAGDLVTGAAPTTKTMGPIEVTEYQGEAFTTNVFCDGLARCIVKNAAGAIVLSFTHNPAEPPYAGTFPATAATMYLSNDFGFSPDPYLHDADDDPIVRVDWSILSIINITEPSGALHTFNGTSDISLVGGAVFFISNDKSDTAENLRQALLSDAWVSANYDLVIPFVVTETTVQNGSVLSIISKGYGAEFNMILDAPNNGGDPVYDLNTVHPVSQNGDSISGEATTAEIDLDVYRDAPIFLGQDDAPVSIESLGNFAITLSKTYAGSPVWFELNALFSRFGRFTLPPSTAGWFNTGTMSTYRFVARVAGMNNYSFYQSNALYVLNGYGPASDPVDLEDYVYKGPAVKLLTNKPRTPYIRGQREYLNFIFSDPDRGSIYAPDYTVQILYRAYTTNDTFIGSGYSDTVLRSQLNEVNTCPLRIDDVLDDFPTCGIMRVSLARGNAIISNDLEYTIRPECLHALTQFTFLNRLGGWDTFNFDTAPKEDVKVTFDTFNKTVIPGFSKGDSIETVYAADVDAVKTVEGAPVTDEVGQWLKEAVAATVMLDGDGNYIVKTDFTLAISDTTKNMQIPVLKYRLSETYNNE